MIENLTQQLYLDTPKSIEQEDQFQRYEFAKRIAGALSSQITKTSLVVGLYGKWGEGKSSVLNFIASELPKETVVVKFNPWLYTDEQHLLRSFFSSVAIALDEKIVGNKERIGAFLNDYSGFIGAFTQFAGVSTDGLKDIGAKLKENSIEKVREKINEIINASGKKIVIFIDDIDRLDVSEIQFIFKVVKLAADFPNTAYVLAFDDEMVANALAPKYGAGDNKNSGYLFLDKIIQVPLKLPKINFSVLREHTLKLVYEVITANVIDLSESEIVEFVEGFDKCFMSKVDNPRSGLRYANSLSFAIPLLRGEVNIVDLMLVEAIKVFYPELYDFIRANPDLFLKAPSSKNLGNNLGNRDEDRKKFIDDIIAVYGAASAGRLKDLLCELFPQLMCLFKNIVEPEDHYKSRIQQQRICSNFHFQRYFSYVVKSGDVSDVYFTEFLKMLESNTTSEIVAKIRESFDLYDSAMLYKLLYWDSGLNQQQLKNLALTIYRNPDILSSADDSVSFGSISWMLQTTIIKGIFKLNAEVRQEFLVQILRDEVSLNLGMEITYHIFKDSDQAYDHDKITEDQKRELENILIEKFKSQLTEDNFFEQMEENELRELFFIWKKNDLDELRSLIVRELDGPGQAGIKLLKVFVPTVIRSSDHGNFGFKSALTRKHYIDICIFVDPERLFLNLTSTFGLRNSGPDMTNLSDRTAYSDEDLVYIFQHYYLNKV